MKSNIHCNKRIKKTENKNLKKSFNERNYSGQRFFYKYLTYEFPKNYNLVIPKYKILIILF